MFTINIIIGDKSTAVNIHPDNSAQQVLDFLRREGWISKMHGFYYLKYNGSVLPFHAPLSQFGIGANVTLDVVSSNGPGFGGGGRETLLQNLLQAFSKLKKS
jgi:hypothetical protein